MILPDLNARIAWYKDAMRPDDPAIGAGISDWAISWEWRPRLDIDGVGDAWGCTCSPVALPAIRPLSTEDVTEKRAHLIFRTPQVQSDLGEIERTLLHELGHVLLAPLQSPHVHAEENAMHSLDAVFAKLSPEQGQILARAMKDPKARAVARGEAMPSPEDKKAEEKTPEAEVKKQEAAPRTVAEIEQAIAAAAIAGQPTDELVKELLAALVARGAKPSSEAPEPASVPPMGMVDQGTMARAIAKAQDEAKAAQDEAKKAIVDANPHLNAAQKAIVLEQPNAAKARAVADSYGRPQSAQDPKMGMEKHPAAGGGRAETVRARLMRETRDEVKARVFRGRSKDNTSGMNLDQPGYTLVYSPGKHLSEMRGEHEVKP